MRAGAPADIARLGGARGELARRRARDRGARGRAVRRGPPWRFAVAAAVGGRRARCWPATATGPRRSSRRCGERAVVAHDAKALGRRAAAASPTTRCSAPTCSSRPGAATRSPSCAKSAASPATSRTRSPPTRCCCGALADWQREQIAERGLRRRDARDRAAARGRPARDGAARRAAEPRAPGRDHRARARGDRPRSKRTIFALAGEEFLISSPQQLGEILFEKLGLSRKRRGKTGFSTDARVLQAIRAEHEIVPEDRALARALDADQDLSRRAARSWSTSARASTRRSCRPVAQTGRLVEHQPEHAERPDPHAARARDPRLLRGRGRATC